MDSVQGAAAKAGSLVLRNISTKLILIEGIPGSGKTTTAQFVNAWLAIRGARPALYLEGNLDHPADFESFACLDAGEYGGLVSRFPGYGDFLAQKVVRKGQDHFFSYRKLEQEYGDRLPEALVQELRRYEIYELPVEKYLRLSIQRWQDFTGEAAKANKTYIFECCFLQNPLTMLLGRNDEEIGFAQEHILKLAEIIQTLDPLLIYLHPGEVKDTLQRVAQTRPPEWLDFVISYHTRQGHGKNQGWEGFDGMVRFYEMRQAIELGLLPRLPAHTLLVQHENWEQDRERIAAFLEEFLYAH